MLLEEVWNYKFGPATNLVDAHWAARGTRSTVRASSDDLQRPRCRVHSSRTTSQLFLKLSPWVARPSDGRIRSVRCSSYARTSFTGLRHGPAGLFAIFITVLFGFIYFKIDDYLISRSDRMITTQIGFFAGLPRRPPDRRALDHLRQDFRGVYFSGLFDARKGIGLPVMSRPANGLEIGAQARSVPLCACDDKAAGVNHGSDPSAPAPRQRRHIGGRAERRRKQGKLQRRRRGAYALGLFPAFRLLVAGRRLAQRACPQTGRGEAQPAGSSASSPEYLRERAAALERRRRFRAPTPSSRTLDESGDHDQCAGRRRQRHRSRSADPADARATDARARTHQRDNPWNSSRSLPTRPSPASTSRCRSSRRCCAWPRSRQRPVSRIRRRRARRTAPLGLRHLRADRRGQADRAEQRTYQAKPHVRGDRALSLEAVANLVDNAIKFTPRSGSVNLEPLRGEGETILRVTDTGPGISDQEHEAVIRRFYRSDHLATRRVSASDSTWFGHRETAPLSLDHPLRSGRSGGDHLPR